MTHEGSCHCGKVTFEVDGEPQAVIECNCSHCRRKGYLLWFVPRADFRLLTGEDDLKSYQYNRHVIDHQFCGHCGCAPFAFGNHPATGEATAAVNVRCLPALELDDLERQQVDGRSL